MVVRLSLLNTRIPWSERFQVIHEFRNIFHVRRVSHRGRRSVSLWRATLVPNLNRVSKTWICIASCGGDACKARDAALILLCHWRSYWTESLPTWKLLKKYTQVSYDNVGMALKFVLTRIYVFNIEVKRQA